jgi:cytosine/adenosine deaminase-related metal-dependent hydrolase
MKKVLIEGGIVVTMDPARRIIQQGAVLIERDAIVAVGKAEEIKERYPEAERIDARNSVILPGFIDTHVHLSEHIVRGVIPDDVPDWMAGWLMPIYSSLTPEDEYVSSLLAFIEMVKTGTTTFCEAGTCIHLDPVLRAMPEVGIRGILGKWTWDLPQAPQAMKQTTDQALKLNEEMLKKVKRLGNEKIAAWPLLLGMGTVSDDLMIGAKRLAEDYGVGIGMMHSSSIPSMETRNKIERLHHFEEIGLLGRNLKLTHMVYLDEDEIDLLKKYEIKVSHCPTAAMKHCKGLSRYGKFPEMVERGICVSLGADSANGSDHLNMLRIMQLVASLYKDVHMKESIFPAESVLEMVTLRAAEALLMEKKVGSIEPGKKADLVLFDRDHPEWRPLLNLANTLVYSVSDRSIDSVFIGGRQVLKEGKLAGIDEQAIYAKAEDLSRKLLQRANLPVPSKWPWV